MLKLLTRNRERIRVHIKVNNKFRGTDSISLEAILLMNNTRRILMQSLGPLGSPAKTSHRIYQ